MACRAGPVKKKTGGGYAVVATVCIETTFSAHSVNTIMNNSVCRQTLKSN